VDKEGEPLLVDIYVSGKPKSSVFNLQAISSNPLFTQTYLKRHHDGLSGLQKNVRQEVSGDTLASISEQMQRWERDLNTEQDALLAFERTNNLAILQEEATVAGSYLTKLKRNCRICNWKPGSWTPQPTIRVWPPGQSR